MTLTRSVLVTTPVVRQEESDSVWQARPFKLQVGDVDVMLSYAELNKITIITYKKRKNKFADNL